MKIILFSLLAFVSVEQSSGSPACQAALEELQSCIRPTFNSIVQRVDIDSKVRAMQQCFQRANCQFNTKPASKGSCDKRALKELSDKIERCMQPKVPGFSFRNLFKKGHSFNFQQAQSKLSKVALVVQDSKHCLPKDRAQVDTCRRRIQGDVKAAAAKHLDELCASKDSCMAKAPGNCQKEFGEMKTNLVNCACSILKTESAKYAEEVMQCLGHKGNKFLTKFVEKTIPTVCRSLERNANFCQILKSLLTNPLSDRLG